MDAGESLGNPIYRSNARYRGGIGTLTTLRFCSFCLLFLVPIGTAAGAEMGESLTLDKAVEQALSHHQAIQAAKARVTGTEGLRLQAGFRPNPELFLQTENWRFTGVPGFQVGQDLDAFAYVSQPLETGGKRALRVAAAQQDLKIAELEKIVETAWRWHTSRPAGYED